jgi:hypothetical protein
VNSVTWFYCILLVWLSPLSKSRLLIALYDVFTEPGSAGFLFVGRNLPGTLPKNPAFYHLSPEISAQVCSAYCNALIPVTKILRVHSFTVVLCPQSEGLNTGSSVESIKASDADAFCQSMIKSDAAGKLEASGKAKLPDMLTIFNNFPARTPIATARASIGINAYLYNNPPEARLNVKGFRFSQTIRLHNINFNTANRFRAYTTLTR